MTSVVTLEKQVEKIKQKIMPKHNKDIVIVFSFGPNSEPHGKYGYRKLHVFEEYYVNGQRYEAPSIEEEMQYMRKSYDELPAHAKRQHDRYNWTTFEDYVHICPCFVADISVDLLSCLPRGRLE